MMFESTETMTPKTAACSYRRYDFTMAAFRFALLWCCGGNVLRYFDSLFDAEGV